MGPGASKRDEGPGGSGVEWPMAGRIPVVALAAALTLATSIARAQSLSARDPAGTVGVHLLDLAPDTIGLRYHMRVNACADHASKKIVFVGVRTATPGALAGSGNGTLDFDVMTDWVEYQDDLGYAGWPEQGFPHRGEPSLWVRNVDYGGVGRVGLRFG